MAQDSKRKRQLRRVKRERTLAHRFIAQQDQQRKQLVHMVVQQQDELKTLRPEPSFTVETLPDSDNYYPVNDDTPEFAQFEEDHLGVVPDVPAGPVTEELNRDCCIDDSATS